MQTLSQIKAMLAAHGLRPKHRLGQNFLIDQAKLDAIVAAAAMGPDELVLEVGPGTGTLTHRLLAAGASVLAVEIDRQLAPLLLEQFDPLGSRFELLQADILAGKHEINPLVLQRLEARQAAAKGFKLIANLPYQVASPLLINLALDHPAMRVGLVMVQKEVADRLAAPPGNKDYGAMSVLVQAMCEVSRVMTLPPCCFWPQPQVTSAVVKLSRRDQPLTDQPHQLAALTHTLFSQRRKQLGTILGRHRHWPSGVSGDMRPEALSVEQLVTLSREVG